MLIVSPAQHVVAEHARVVRTRNELRSPREVPYCERHAEVRGPIRRRIAAIAAELRLAKPELVHRAVAPAIEHAVVGQSAGVAASESQPPHSLIAVIAVAHRIRADGVQDQQRLVVE